ncbi:response regulator transcription factor [Nocardioides sp. zg-536]|uniref:Response regulator transcription factor n=1 Tax=Nocardioides faecalis TaxID=2803858 RepID=A0A938Y740_9ACTN|nr:response regulator transcription factor [Nocardioides faecalis]MBM9458434.1 response regulator transcription factor [Nocardioides faecalis]MBS4753258.1 response regulator transcription factor [Nocardioides faecalis]QVI58449.1 response regulator transcription factor [Nocardioides faecalis]
MSTAGDEQEQGQEQGQEQRRIRILLVDDEALVRAGLRMLLSSAPDVEVVGEASDGVEVVDQVRSLSPDIVLMDIRMPKVDGLRALALVRALPEPPSVVILTTFDLDEHLAEALEKGAAGFLLKDTPPAALIQAIRTVASGNAILSPTLTGRLSRSFGHEAPPELQTRISTLSDRELRVLTLIAQGSSNAEIAHELYLSEATVKAHVTHILGKLDASNRVQAAIMAYRAGLLPDDWS